ncbi:MAG: helix-turn-helix domain-containing protein [Chloroflexi bacterium]|nr:helix-turn-helix domain-containing protein [Chloroflexota bacterium]
MREVDSQAGLIGSLFNTAHVLFDAEDPEDVLGEVAECVGQAVGASEAVIALLRGDSHVLQVAGVYGDASRLGCDLGATVPLAQIVRDRSLLMGTEPILLDDGSSLMPTRTNASPGTVLSPTILFPITCRGTVLGLLFIALGNGTAELSLAHVRLCQTVAKELAAALRAAESQAIRGSKLSQTAVAGNLVRMVLDRRGLSTLVAALDDLVENPVVLVNSVFHLIAHSPRQEGTDRMRRDSLDQGGVPREAMDDPLFRRQLHRVIESKGPLITGSFLKYGLVQRRLEAPIWTGSDLLGLVAAAESRRPFTDSDCAIVEDATVALGLELVNQRAKLETEHRLRADFLAELLAGVSKDTPSLIERAGFLGIDLCRPWDLLVLDVDEGTGPKLASEQADQMVAKRRILEAIHHLGNSPYTRPVAVIQGRNIVVLAPNPSLDGGRSRRLAEAIRQEVSRHVFHGFVSVGVGETCRSLEDFPRSYARARRALEAARSLGLSNAVISLGDLGVYGILSRKEDEGELLQFADKMLGPLVEYDHKRGSALLETLHAYLEEDRNQRRTATRLFIHPNTLAQRLARIAAVAKLDLNDSDTRLNLQLAFRVLKLAGRTTFGQQ